MSGETSKTWTSGEKTVYCSFCNKSQYEVTKVIAGPSVYICNECVDLCNEIIRKEVTDKRKKTHEQKTETRVEILLRKEIAVLEDAESQSSEIPFEWISTTPVCFRHTV